MAENIPQGSQPLARERRAAGAAKKTATREQFLDGLAQGLSVASAAQAAGLARGTLYRWRAQSKSFHKAWQDAYDAGTDRLEDEARRRAVEGVEKPVFRGGEIVGHVTDYSDTMLMFLLKARRPEIFAQVGSKRPAIPAPPSGELANAHSALYRKFAEIFAEEPDSALSEDPDTD